MSSPQKEDELDLRTFVGLAMFGFKYHDYILTPPTIPKGKYPSERAIADLDKVMRAIESHTNSEVRQCLDRVGTGILPNLEGEDYMQAQNIIEAEKRRYE